MENDSTLENPIDLNDQNKDLLDIQNKIGASFDNLDAQHDEFLDWYERKGKKIKNNPWARSRLIIKFPERLKQLGITQYEFDLYWTLFVQEPSKYFCKRFKFGEWYQVNNKLRKKAIPLTKYALIHHLSGEYWISKPPPRITNYFCIDLDKDKNEDDPIGSLHDRFMRVVSTFGEPITVRSSSSGGLHLYYFTDPYPSKYLGRLLVEYCKRYQLTIKSGKIELFPGTISQLRLPLGSGSCILHNDTLTDKKLTMEESIHYFEQHRYKSFVSIKKLSLPITYDEGFGLEIFRKIKRVYYNTEELKHQNISSAFIKSILNSRLKPGERHEKTMYLVAYCINEKGMKPAETERFIWRYLNKPGHNSKDLRKDKKKVQQDVRGLIKNYYKKRFFRNVDNTYKVKLSREDISFIISTADELKKDTKFDHHAFHMIRFMFRIFQFYKWKNEKVLDLPYSILIKHTSKRRVGDYVNKLCEWGMLICIREANQKLHLSRKYRLNYNISSDGEFSDVEDALIGMYNKTELFSMCTRGIYNKLQLKRV
jgi:hypothetical protein